jgi:hypothetical protein
MKNNFWIILSSILVLFLVSCQEDSFTGGIDAPASHTVTNLHRTCATSEHCQQLMQDPSYAKLHAQKLRKVAEMILLKSGDCTSPKIIPVAVHYQGVTGIPDISCLRSLAQQQIDVLNKDFTGTNNDINKWNQAVSSFQGITNGAVCARFVLANANHPTGYGINDGQPAVTVNKTSGDQDNKWTGYLNIYIQTGTGVLGYAPYGGSGNGDGVVIEATAFGAGITCGSIGSEAPYDLGRTTTHEIGHYMLLDHIWGENGGCSEDDGVSDTPNASEANYDCPNLGKVSCNSTDMHMNYMDYTNDACMYMFTAGQASRMTNYINSSLSSITNNASNVIMDNGGGSTDGDSTDEGEDNTGDGTDEGEDTEHDETDEENNTDEDTGDTETNGACDLISIQITLDEYGSETTWRLKNEFNELIVEGGPYQDGQSGSVKIEEVCLDENGCHSLIIKDAYGDGICCDYGNGKVEILDSNDNLITASDGYFGRKDELIVCRDNQGLYRKSGKKEAKSKNNSGKKKGA